jgi:L-2-hydroxyglutarate oxidase
MIEFCKAKKINHEVCGEIILTSNFREIGFLGNLADRGNKNGLKGLKFLSNNEKKSEPHARAKKALLVPEEEEGECGLQASNSSHVKWFSNK